MALTLTTPNTVLGALSPKSQSARLVANLVTVVLGSLVLALSAKISVPVMPIPVTLQTLAVAALAAGFGWRIGVATVALYIVQGLSGLPVFATGGGLADVFHMADALQVSRADALGVFDRFKIEGGIRNRGTRIIEENYAPSFHLETARKDVRLMIESAGREPVPVLRAVAERMDALIAKGLGDDDMAVLAKKGV